MSREAHVQFCERLGVRLPGATHRNIYVASERAGKRVMQSVTRFLQRRLKLKVNETKSAVARPQERKFLGFSFPGGAEVKRRTEEAPLAPRLSTPLATSMARHGRAEPMATVLCLRSRRNRPSWHFQSRPAFRIGCRAFFPATTK